MFDTLEERKSFIEKMTDYVRENFKDNFNLFIFGSFLTEEFEKDSDLDMAIYTRGDMLELDFIVNDFLKDYEIACDTIMIKPEFCTNFIDINALCGYRCTDWFPEELKRHLAELTFLNMENMKWRIQWHDALQYALRRG